jgi:hypothetical protein
MADEYDAERRLARDGDARDHERDDLRDAALREGAALGPAPGGVRDLDRDEGGAARGGPPPAGSLDDLLEHGRGPVDGAHLVEGALEEGRRRHTEPGGGGAG